ncbi:MAG: hypothetical protein KKG10_16540 [Proteobacteria bacterium]|nr:hypothetical protein [Pseudomonadota bacterium]
MLDTGSEYWFLYGCCSEVESPLLAGKKERIPFIDFVPFCGYIKYQVLNPKRDGQQDGIG